MVERRKMQCSDSPNLGWPGHDIVTGHIPPGRELRHNRPCRDSVRRYRVIRTKFAMEDQGDRAAGWPLRRFNYSQLRNIWERRIELTSLLDRIFAFGRPLALVGEEDKGGLQCVRRRRWIWWTHHDTKSVGRLDEGCEEPPPKESSSLECSWERNLDLIFSTYFSITHSHLGCRIHKNGRYFRCLRNMES